MDNPILTQYSNKSMSTDLINLLKICILSKFFLRLINHFLKV